MPRKGQTRKRTVPADPVYSNVVVTKLVNQIMLDGKKGVAQKIVYGAFVRIREKTGKEPVEVFETAMNNIIALRWLTSFSRARGEKTQEERLAGELMDAANNTGSAVKRKEDMHKMAEANKAFAHYRF